MKIKKAVIAVAGSGTRLLPATKAMPKEMLPIVDKPIIQLVVEELVEAGIEDIIFVTRWDKKPLEDHFDHSVALEDDLIKNGKTAAAEKISKIAEMANFVHVRQKGPYGNGTPILSAASLVDDEPFIFCFGDDLVKSEVSFTKQMVDDYEKNGNLILGVQEVKQEDVVRYGIVKLKEGTNQMEDIIEKPLIEDAPSRLAGFGRYILNQEIIDILRTTSLGKGNELWITDAIKEYIKRGGVMVAKEIKDGQWLTTGDPANYLKTILAYASDRDDLKDTLAEFIQSQK
ncbi:MAG: UTP-glucose-1-phosphate uridylyltransferase [Candidatus Moranbacteria bacterium GW2011_GWA2_39_41]|nr:MAG: UTP-glucose-1-phosphate uridylyltransferase [Candidatus Moranbacteria bacterium GW2011_GWA2_39_41]